jgi:hypothetical protein
MKGVEGAGVSNALFPGSMSPGRVIPRQVASQQSQSLFHPTCSAYQTLGLSAVRYRNYVLIRHHEGQPPIPLIRMLTIKSNDGFPLLVIKPKVPRDCPIMLIDLPIPRPPIVKVALGYGQAGRKTNNGRLGKTRPPMNEIHQRIPGIRWNPHVIQISPRLFLAQHAPP